MPKQMTCTFEEAELIFRNFKGKETPMNARGVRNFCVIIPDEDTADRMAADGWRIKRTKVKEEGDVARPFIKVSVRFDVRPPKIFLITEKARTIVDEDMCEVLDYTDIANVDLVISAYNYDFNGDRGIKAYLKSMYVTVDEDDLDRKYALDPVMERED